MLQALLNLFKIKKTERIEPVIEPVAVVNDQITDSVTQQAPVVEKTKKPSKPRQSKKK